MVLENYLIACTKVKLDFYLIPLTKVISKCVKDLDIGPDTIKLLKENREEAL